MRAAFASKMDLTNASVQLAAQVYRMPRSCLRMGVWFDVDSLVG